MRRREFLIVLLLVLVLASCGRPERQERGSGEERRQEAVSTGDGTNAEAARLINDRRAESTTTLPDAALAAAAEACRFGDGATRTGVDTLRTALERRGERTASMSNDAVIRRWLAVVDEIGDDAADELQRAAAASDYRRATEAAARAAALDSRWDKLHRGLSEYTSYLESPLPPSSGDEVKAWFTDVRVACERVRALSG
jgi:hypothetical protein